MPRRERKQVVCCLLPDIADEPSDSLDAATAGLLPQRECANGYGIKSKGETVRRDPLRKAHAVPAFADTFLATMLEFKAEIVKTRGINHSGVKGGLRESALASFFANKLPNVYGVVTGEVVDLENKPSPQLDVMFYNKTRDFPFISETAAILPAEALLASIEVKSKLTSEEAKKSVSAARKLRQLRPFKMPLGGDDIEDPSRSKRQARYFHCLFSYDTDLSPTDWHKNEYRRFVTARENDGHDIDFIYVLGRGVINVREAKVVLEDESTAHALTIFYFAMLNFLDRETGRRGPTPYSSYAAKMGGNWTKIVT